MGEDGFYLKLPLVVEAKQVDSDTTVALDSGNGVLTTRAGDWIVTGPDGRRWVVADAIFSETYMLTEVDHGEDQ